MSVTEEIQDVEASPPPTVTPVTHRVLLVWDAPNLDMGLGSILGGRPTAAHRPRFDALGRWLLARTAELAAGRPDISSGAGGHRLHQHRPGQRRRGSSVGGGIA